MVKKVLVPLDGSEHADKALDFALDLAETYSAEILLLSIVHVSPIAYIAPHLDAPTSSSISIRNYEKEIEGYLKRVLSEAVEKAKKAKPYLNVSTKLVEGRPADKIVEMAKEEKVDIIVMGHRGVSGIKKLFLGSISNQVINEASCPVLIVK